MNKKKLRVGITGCSGFVAGHLLRYLSLRDDYQPHPFIGDLLKDPAQVRRFVRECDIIVHMAAKNRHENPQVLHHTNVELARALIAAMRIEQIAPHVIFSSSSQEEYDNPYGNAKRESRRLFEEWAEGSGAKFTGMIIPNIFGPFGKPNYNSVIATFCHKIVHNQEPQVLIDTNMKLIYVGDLCQDIIRVIDGKVAKNPYTVPHRAERKVSAILETLRYFKAAYIDQGSIPRLHNDFDIALFNTFLCYIDHAAFFPFRLIPHEDARGRFVEVLRLNDVGGQVSFSTTIPGVTRGNHFHTRKLERFVVLKGKARIQLRKIGSAELTNFELSGDMPAFVDMPVWHTHNITNIGDEDLYTIFWTNEFFDPQDPDTFFETV